MNADPQNFLNPFLQSIVTGDQGFFKDVSLAPQSMATTGTRATASATVPADAIVLDADDEDVIVNFTIPREYDGTTDGLKIFLLTRHVSGTSIDLGATAVSSATPTVDLVAKTGFVAPTATTIDAAFDIGEIEVDLSGLSWIRHESAHINFAASALTGVGVAHVIGCRVEFNSTLVSYEECDTDGTAIR